MVPPGAVDDKYMFTYGESAVIPDQQKLKNSISDPGQCTQSAASFQHQRTVHSTATEVLPC